MHTKGKSHIKADNEIEKRKRWKKQPAHKNGTRAKKKILCDKQKPKIHWLRPYQNLWQIFKYDVNCYHSSSKAFMCTSITSMLITIIMSTNASVCICLYLFVYAFVWMWMNMWWMNVGTRIFYLEKSEFNVDSVLQPLFLVWKLKH